MRKTMEKKANVVLKDAKIMERKIKRGITLPNIFRLFGKAGVSFAVLLIISMRKPQADKVVRGPGTGESMAVGD